MIPFRHSYLAKKSRARHLERVRRARRRRELKKRYGVQSTFDRLVYAVINGIAFVLVGIFLDLFITLIRSIMGMGDGSVFWLFAPILLVIGTLIGALSGAYSGTDSMNMIGAPENPRLEDISIRHDILHGIGVGIFLFALIWLILLILI